MLHEFCRQSLSMPHLTEVSYKFIEADFLSVFVASLRINCIKSFVLLVHFNQAGVIY